MTLREWLWANKMTQREFATSRGIKEQVVSRWINGHARPKDETMRDIYKLTDGAVSYADWFT